MTKKERKEAEKKIEEFFQREKFNPEELKKIRRMAMKFKIKLGDKRKKYCKRCFNRLEGKIKITREHKTIICGSCGFPNKWKLVGK